MKICKRTLEALKDFNSSSLKDMQTICMKNHTLKKYGLITKFSIEYNDFIIIDRETRDFYEFDSPEALVEAGWMVD